VIAHIGAFPNKYTIKHAPLYGAGFAAASKIQVSGYFSFRFKKWSLFIS
jgi:hypothetical protein